ncbi:MAG: tetratricopeptide repeat protein [Thermodesulfobacteriota bacterium]
MAIIFGIISAGLIGSIIFYHYSNYKIPFVERYFQLIDSKIWRPPPDILARARAVKENVKVFPIDGPLYEESGKLFYSESRQPAIPSGILKKREIVNIISVGKRRGEERSRISVKIRSSAGMIGYVGVPGDVEITRIFSDEAAYRLLPAKLWYEWEGNPEGPLHEAGVYQEFIKSFPGSKYFPNAKVLMSLNYWAASTLYEHPMQPYLQKDIKKAEVYRNLARNNLKEILIKFPGSNFAIIANKYLKKIERGEKHPYVTQDEKALKSIWALEKELQK